ncbi:MAG: hypothetical protein ACYCZI_01745 [Metallibacterium scheffleri]|jgi:hypothetical protein|nr:hypothetical protein [Pseudomonadota bacterium]
MAITERQQAILDARSAQQQAADALGKLHQQLNTLRTITQTPRDVQARFDAAQASYRDDLGKWAATGATGATPTPPPDLVTLQAQLSEAHAQAEAAAAAAASLQPKIDAAQANVAEAFRRVGAAVLDFIAQEALPPLVQAARAANLQTHALRQQIAALGIVAPEFRDLMPGLTRLSGITWDAAMDNSVELVPHGAEASRVQWRGAISALLEGEPFVLGTAPATRYLTEPRRA